MHTRYGVVDLFAGPGGLAEGFAKARRDDGSRPYSIELSIEKEASAHRTLTLRSFLRQFDAGPPPEYYDALNAGHGLPDWSAIYPEEWRRATEEALRIELGIHAPDDVNSRLDRIRNEYDGNVVLIGGPPCQAYSLVGRARNLGIAGYSAADDHRHFLYREYIRILERLQPAVFVMENVKGILSSRVGKERVFDRILEDLRDISIDNDGYTLVALKEGGATGPDAQPRPRDFIVRTEEYGVPQARHRVIVVGVRPDIASRLSADQLHGGLLHCRPKASVADVLCGMPGLRSGLSREEDSVDQWRDALSDAIGLVAVHLADSSEAALTDTVLDYAARVRSGEAPERRVAREPNHVAESCASDLENWIRIPELRVLLNHESRGHMRADLARYFFAAVFAEVHGRSPKAADYPGGLAPSHRNWETGKFADRFRVQRWNAPSSTVTSHISKDGHYFIHPDPLQCRSLTVREAARLQTFPDDYLFLGNRTQQYIQVGNAVPPFIAKQIGEAIVRLLEGNMQPAVTSRTDRQISLWPAVVNG